METQNEQTQPEPQPKKDMPRSPWRTVVYVLCTLAAVLWVVAATVNAWLPFATKGANTGALDDIVHTAGVLGAALCWLLAVCVAVWQRKRLADDVRWLPLWVLLVLAALKVLAYLGSDHQQAQTDKAAISGDKVRGYLSSENLTEDKAILVYFMDFPGTSPNDEKLLKPTSVIEDTGRRTGGGGETSLSPMANYSLNTPKRLRWYIWHITKRGEWVKNPDGSTAFIRNALVTDPKIPVVVCEATVPVYVSLLRDEIEKQFVKEGSSKLGENWRTELVNLVATFYGDGRVLTLTAPWGYIPKQHPTYSADILQHQHQGDCK